MRRPHYLKRNNKVELPQHLMFVDTEANIEYLPNGIQRQTLRLGVLCYVRIRDDRGNHTSIERWHRFSTCKDFWELVESYVPAKGKLWLFCHNWNYDAAILSLATIPEANGWKCLSYINDNPPLLVRLRKEGRTVLLVDTLNYFRTSLAALGESIGPKKETMPEFEAADEDWYRYCEQDVEVLKQAMLAFRGLVEKEELGNFQPTLASQAMMAFRHRFMEQKILIHGEAKVCKLEREAYHGARTEAYYLGKREERVYYLDINSMYPYIMQTHPFPHTYKSSFPAVSVERLGAYLNDFAVIAQVKIRTDAPIYPHRYQQRTIFPIGTFNTSLCTPEIVYALKHNHIVEVYRGAKYLQDNLFAGYVQTLYRLRKAYAKEGNEAFSYLSKILLNSLYGKFGQNGQKWQDIHNDENAPTEEWVVRETPDSPIRRFRGRLGKLQELKKEGETQNSFPGIAAHVTAYGRIMLWELIEKAGRENVFYCDTDSLLVNVAGYNALSANIDTHQLGSLKVEQQEESFIIYGAKDYRIGVREKHKGIKAKARRINVNTWMQETFRSWDWHLQKTADGFVQVETHPKTLHRVYKKGTPTKSGWVLPLRAEEIGLT